MGMMVKWLSATLLGASIVLLSDVRHEESAPVIAGLLTAGIGLFMTWLEVVVSSLFEEEA